MKQGPITVYRAAAVKDAGRIDARPGAVMVRHGRVIAAGQLDHLPRRYLKQARFVDLPDSLLMPAMVNAHAHLDLSDIGPVPYNGDFIDWLRQAIDQRPQTYETIAAAVHRGLAMSRTAGVGFLGDIAGSIHAIHARRHAPQAMRLVGVSYLECFGHGPNQKTNLEQAAMLLDDLSFETDVPGIDRGGVLGLSPHAPYSAGLDLYNEAVKLGQRRIYRLTTHLAESPEELEFVKNAAGPFAEMLQAMGKWQPSIQPTGLHPVNWLEPALKRGRWLLAHANYLDDEHIGILQRTGTSVVYCPIASDYFGHRNHRYRDLLEAGVNVCLGTDSILCQPAEEPQPMSILAQMRYLYRRDNTDPDLLLAMATTHGMIGMELSEYEATLQKGSHALLAKVTINPDDGKPPLVQALEGNQPCEILNALNDQ